MVLCSSTRTAMCKHYVFKTTLLCLEQIRKAKGQIVHCARLCTHDSLQEKHATFSCKLSLNRLHALNKIHLQVQQHAHIREKSCNILRTPRNLLSPHKKIAVVSVHHNVKEP